MPSKAKGADAQHKSKDAGDKHTAKDCTQHWEDAVQLEKGQKQYQDFKQQDGQDDEGGNEVSDDAKSSASASASREDEHPDHQPSIPQKRGRGANASQKGPNKKAKATKTTTTGRSDSPQGLTAGDKTRVPAKGQQVQWHALPGYVSGEVVEVVYEDKTVEGKHVKGSKEDPRVVLRSEKSGKIAVHKPEVVYFD